MTDPTRTRILARWREAYVSGGGEHPRRIGDAGERLLQRLMRIVEEEIGDGTPLPQTLREALARDERGLWAGKDGR